MKLKKILKIKPSFNGIICTADRNEKPAIIHGIQQIKDLEGQIQSIQKIVAVGPAVKNCKEGDIVMLSFDRYATLKHLPGSVQEGVQKDNPTMTYKIPTITVDDVEYLRLSDADIDNVIEECIILKDGKEIQYKKES